MKPRSLTQLGDGWYESEQPTTIGLVYELQRIRRRIAARPLPVILLAAMVTAALGYKVVTRQRLVYAQVILALTEGSLTSSRSGVPAEQLRDYTRSVLLSDKNLIKVIEKYDLIPLRSRLGPHFAVEQLWENLEIDIWKNSFLYYSQEDQRARKSARIGITVKDSDPDRGFLVAGELARVAIATHEADRMKLTTAVAQQVALARLTLHGQLTEITTTIAELQAATAAAQKGQSTRVAQIYVRIAALDAQAKALESQLSLVIQSPEAIADQIEAAGLDVQLAIVEERRPERPEYQTVVLVIVITIIGAGALVASALVLGAFDTRIHDTDDVARLGLPVLGHLPAFAGDHIGSLRARGVARSKGSSVLRWLSLR